MNASLIQLRPEGRTSPTDAELLAGCVAKDEAALSLLFHRHHDGLERFLARLLPRGSADTADLIQQVFLTAWNEAHKYEGRSTVRTWIFGIGANLAKRYHRSQGRLHQMLARFGQQPTSSPTCPESLTSQREQADRLAIALEKLPHKLRVTYVLCEVEEVSGAEAAEILNVKPGTIWRRVHEARTLLRKSMSEGELL